MHSMGQKEVPNASVAGTGAAFIFGHVKAQGSLIVKKAQIGLLRRDPKVRMQQSRDFAPCHLWIHKLSNPLARKDWLMNPF